MVLPLLLLAALWGINHIQGDVEEAAAEILERNGISTEGLEFDASYRDVEVSGELPAGVTAAQVETLLEEEEGSEEDEDIRNATILAAAAAVVAEQTGPIDVSATSDGESIVLTGTVPTQEHRDDLVASAEETGLPVDADGLTVSGLSPSSDDADGQIAKLGAVVGGLGVGAFTAASLNIDDAGPVTGSISAADADTAASLTSLADGEDVSVSAPPVLGAVDTTVTFDGDRIVLNGTVLTEEQSGLLEARASEVVGADNVINNLEVSGLDEAVDGADARVTALGDAIATFGGLTSADAKLDDTDLTVNGVASDEANREASVSAVAASADTGLRPGGEITVADAEFTLQEEIDLLQAELDALQEEIAVNVVFDSNSDALTPNAQATLDKVVAAMQRYPRPVVEVGGHTDSQGNDDFNIDLSQRRANSVVEYVGSQTSPDRLQPIGYGESQPVADNLTEEGRLSNRRVEFIAKESF